MKNTEKTMDKIVARVKVKVDVAVCHDLAKTLGDILHFDCAFSCQGGHPFFVGEKPLPVLDL